MCLEMTKTIEINVYLFILTKKRVYKNYFYLLVTHLLIKQFLKKIKKKLTGCSICFLFCS